MSTEIDDTQPRRAVRIIEVPPAPPSAFELEQRARYPTYYQNRPFTLYDEPTPEPYKPTVGEALTAIALIGIGLLAGLSLLAGVAYLVLATGLP